MIVETMTHEEVYAELAKEREAVTTWWQHQLAGERRRALKWLTWPMSIWRDYTSARKNHYLFFSRVFDRKMRTILTGIAVVRHTAEGLTVYTTWLANQRLISPMVMQPHMWRRYAERTCTDLSGVKLIRHYFARNGHGKDSDCQQVVGRSVRYNGEEVNALGVPEGYNAFCTRGVSGWLETTERHWRMAQRISGLEKPNMFVYGGGDDVAEWCKAHDVVHVKEFVNRARGR